MTMWIRFERGNGPETGLVSDDSQSEITVYTGDLFADPTATDETIDLKDVSLLTPCVPSKILGLWNNFNATAEKTGLPRPEHPWYFVMTPNTYAPANSTINRPKACSGKILFEGELGVVIGRTCKEVALADVADYIFGYTCVNDVTAFEFLFNEKDFAHWTRAKCFDGFGVFGPGISQGVDPNGLSIRTILEGEGQVQERQNYPVSDMMYSPHEIVSHLSHDMTLNAGDIIACGTSVGAGAMKDGWTVRVQIDGVGELVNVYSDQPA